MIHSRLHHRGFSLIELMIGMTVGLFILLGASSLMVSQIGDHRRLALETRTEQDVRAMAEVMTREIRSAGAWKDPMKGVWTEASPSPQVNPYANVTIEDGGAKLTFTILDGPSQFVRGYKFSGEVLYRFDGANWQPMTDPNTLKIARFEVTQNEHSFGMESACRLPCDGAENCPPVAKVRDLRIVLEANAKHDSAVRRNLDFVVRLQADALSGVCREA